MGKVNDKSLRIQICPKKGISPIYNPILGMGAEVINQLDRRNHHLGTLPETNSLHLRIGHPKTKNIPTIRFQGQFVSFREGDTVILMTIFAGFATRVSMEVIVTS